MIHSNARTMDHARRLMCRLTIEFVSEQQQQLINNVVNNNIIISNIISTNYLKGFSSL